MNERLDQTHDLVDEGNGVDYMDLFEAARMGILKTKK